MHHLFDSDMWSLSKMLEYVKKEIEAKERATLVCALEAGGVL